VIRPDGKEYGGQPDAAAWPNLPAPGDGILQLSQASLRIRIEPKDPTGRYLVKAQVRDRNRGVTVEVEQPFHVPEGAAQQ
jgi:hypothetical protein